MSGEPQGMDLLRRLVAEGLTLFDDGSGSTLPLAEVAVFLADPLAWKAKARGVSRRMLELWAATGYGYPVTYSREWPLRVVAEVLAVASFGGVNVHHIRLACGHDTLAHLASNQKRSRCSVCHAVAVARLEAMARR